MYTEYYDLPVLTCHGPNSLVRTLLRVALHVAEDRGCPCALGVQNGTLTTWMRTITLSGNIYQPPTVVEASCGTWRMLRCAMCKPDPQVCLVQEEREESCTYKLKFLALSF